jgi:hypothetical protein
MDRVHPKEMPCGLQIKAIGVELSMPFGAHILPLCALDSGRGIGLMLALLEFSLALVPFLISMPIPLS